MKQEIKITTKLLISIVIICLLSMLTFEMAYNRLMYEDYSEMYNDIRTMENRVDRLIEINMKLQKYILEGGNHYGS